MGRLPKTLLATVAVLATALLGAGQAGLLQGSEPADLGVHAGRLRAPSPTPNSVSSQADLWPGHPQREYARIAPLPAGADAVAALARLRAAIEATPGARVERAEGDYLHASFETRWLRFVDDAEFWLDRAAGVIHVRSASRLGRRDFGVNRERIEALRQRMTAGR